MNIQDELSIFQNIAQKERELFLEIISLETHKQFCINTLVTLCKINSDTKGVIAVQKNIDTAWDNLNTSDSVRAWFHLIIKLVRHQPAEETVTNAFNSLVKDEKYPAWSNNIVDKYKELVKIKNDFAVANLGLVNSVVNNLKFNKRINILREDLTQEGYFGLMRAIEKFDCTRGLKFSTYAVWWIRHTCQRHVFDKHILIRTPARTSEVRDKVFEFEISFEKEHNRLPSDAEIQKGTGYSKLTMSTIARPFKIFSLDKTIDIENGEQVNLHEKLEDEHSTQLLDIIDSGQMSLRVQLAIKTLSSREQKILFERFGFNGIDEKSLQEIGKDLQLSREGVRLIQIQALNKIKILLKNLGSDDKEITT